MPIQYHTEFDLPWNEIYQKWIEELSPGIKNLIHVFTWCNQEAINFVNHWGGDNVVLFARGYDTNNVPLLKKKVHTLIVVNDFYLEALKPYAYNTIVTKNPINPNNWTYKERYIDHNKPIKLGFVCLINLKKNIQEIFSLVDGIENIEINIAGEVQDGRLYGYLGYMSEKLEIPVKIYGHVENIDKWLDDHCDILVSTSIMEGNPNNINEAMYKGIIPVIKCFPGAESQYPKYNIYWIAQDGNELLSDIISFKTEIEEYESNLYHNWIVNMCIDKPKKDFFKAIQRVEDTINRYHG